MTFQNSTGLCSILVFGPKMLGGDAPFKCLESHLARGPKGSRADKFHGEEDQSVELESRPSTFSSSWISICEFVKNVDIARSLGLLPDRAYSC